MYNVLFNVIVLANNSIAGRPIITLPQVQITATPFLNQVTILPGMS